MLLLTISVWLSVFKAKYRFNLQKTGGDPEKFVALLVKTGMSYFIHPLGHTIAHLFSGLGDFFLALNGLIPDFQPDLTLGLGVLAFLVAQLFYAFTFSFRFIPEKSTITRSPIGVFYAIPFIIFAISFYALILLKADVQLNTVIRIAIGAYALVISTMGWRAAVQFAYSKHKKYALCRLIGAIVFISSDSTIALTSFMPSIGTYIFFFIPGMVPGTNTYKKVASTIIMVTYWVAQFLISLSVVETTQDHNIMVQRYQKIL